MESSQGRSSQMGGQQEGVCPICMEEMDLTDKELQPCICGYEVCLWCWHFIIQKAAKDGRDARCPACHSPYDKEKILKRTISKERLEMVNANKKHKLPRTKQRPTDLGSDLNSIRVIRRNIVYIAGIPKKLSNEKTLRKKEYLGQYGKIIKIFFAQTDLSRQYYSSDSCIVYVTFSMEEDALRCIQVVNGYILDGRPLKASFGTTRYCHSWLNNLSCKNPDCLYVHHVVPQEDICSREEVISFCTSKLQQCPGLAFTNLKPHSGSFLPPPIDTKNSLPPLGFISNNRYMQCDYFGRSYATVAASHNQSKLFSLNDNLVMPSSRAEVYFPSSTGDHNHVSYAVPTSRNETSLPKHDMEKFSHANPFFGICHSIKTCSPDYKTTIDTNLVAEDNICRPSFSESRPSFRGNHMSDGVIEEPFLCHSDGNGQLSNVRTQASACCLNSLSNIGKCKCESLGSIAKNVSSEWDDLGGVSRKHDTFLSLQTISGGSTSTQHNALPSYDWSRLYSDLGTAKFSCSFENESFSAPSSGSMDSTTFSTITTNLCSSSLSNSGPIFELSRTRDEKFLNHLHSDLGSAKFSCSFEDESLSVPFSKKSKDFSTSTIVTNFYNKLDKPSAIFPRKPILFHGEQKNMCSNSLSKSGPDFEFTATDKTRDEKFLIESCIEQCEGRILSDIFGLDLDAIDLGETHSVLGQPGSSDDLPRISNSSLPSTRDGSKSYFSMMDDLYGAIGQLSAWSNGASGLTNNSSFSEIMVKKEAYMEDSFNNFYLETSKTSEVLNSTSLLSAAEVVSESGSSLGMHHSGSSFSRSVSQHPCSNSTRRTTISTPPGFPPRKTNQGCTKGTSSSHTSSATFNKNLLNSLTTTDTTNRNKSPQRLFLQPISNYQDSWKGQFNQVSSNAIDFGVIGSNKTNITTISSVVPELQNKHLASYF